MDTILLVIGVVTIVLLGVVIILQIIGRKKSAFNEIVTLLKHASEEQRENVQKQLASGATEQFQRFGVIQESVQSTLQASREEQTKQMREFQSQIDKLNTSMSATLLSSRTETNEQLGKFSTQLDTRLSSIGEQTQKNLQTSREETNNQLHKFGEQLDSRLLSIQRSNSENAEKVNSTLEIKMKAIQEGNEKRLEQMQNVVDEKLQKTLESRLTESFALVSKQLDSVQQGLGEMKNLAADAKSLKNALINVKERGTYGEVRLEKLLSDVLAPNQYESNAEIASGKRVEFAIKLPGNSDLPLLLPIDSKFPIEDYNRLLDAEDKLAIDDARKSLVRTIRESAKNISEKYILPPRTTDFALMFLPTEGLYAEVVQNAALFEELRDRYKVTAVGATTLSAFLSSLQMGFKTLAIEQRSQEVWDTLRAVKKQFEEFEKVLTQAQNQLQTVDTTIGKLVGTRTRMINKALRSVEVLDDTNSQVLLVDMEEVEGDE